MRLCSTCLQFNIQEWNSETSPWRGFPLSVVVKGALDECNFCTLLIQRFLGIHDTYSQRYIRLEHEIQTQEGGSTLWCWYGWERLLFPPWVHMKIRRVQETSRINQSLGIQRLSALIAPFLSQFGRFGGTIEFSVASDPGTPPYDNGDVVGTITEKAIISKPDMQRIKNEFQQCIGSPEQHSRCHETLSRQQKLQPTQAELPTRLVRIFRTGAGEIDACLEVTKPGEHGSYATLSHRWDQETEKHSTTLANLEFGGGIRDGMKALSTLFRDAITICHTLDIEYIWIDSICIIQDDFDGDWKREASKMAAYYQRSILTIAATAYDADRGYFQPQDLSVKPPLACLPYRDRQGSQTGKIFLQAMGPADHEAEYQQQITSGTLLSRGWTFQEWILSRRILCFTKSTPLFHCQTMRPVYPDGYVISGGVRSVIGSVVRSSVTDITAMRMITRVNFSKSDEITSAWEKVVESYTATDLTKPLDRLIALAGMAREFGGALYSMHSPTLDSSLGTITARYSCGLWLSDVSCGLLWERVQSGRCCLRNNRFPTWSWASITEMVYWPRYSAYTIENMSRLVEARAIHPLDDPATVLATGISSAGLLSEYSYDSSFSILKLEAHMHPVTIHSYFGSEVDADVLGRITGVFKKDRNCGWRTVSLLSDLEITGYANVEHPEMQVDGTKSDNSVEVFALVVSKSGALNGAVIGNLLPWHYIYNVLFVRKTNMVRGVPVVGDDLYERVGSGKLFGNAFQQAFRDTRKVTVRLV